MSWSRGRKWRHCGSGVLRSLVLMALLSGISSTLALGENWPDWRGPSLNSVVSGDGYPLSWSEDSNIVWKVRVPGWGTSTPAIWDENIFLTAAEDDGSNLLICLNRAGKERWKVTLGKAPVARNRKASAANPSPVTDGEMVYGYYKNGDLACVDFSGKVVWQTNLQEKFGQDRLNWDLGTSPVLTRQAVVIAVMHQGPSYVVAFDRKTGEQLWKVDRDLGAPAEARDSYTTPVVLEADGQQQVLVLGGDFLTCYAAADGKELWRVGGFNPEGARNFRSISSPVVSDGLVLAPYARGNTLTAVRLGGNGDVTKSHVVWSGRGAADVPTPVVLGGRAYICGDRGDVRCVDVKSGDEVWAIRLPRNRYPYSSSPVVAGGHLYCTREDGTTFVVKLTGEPQVVSENALRENTYATPAFADGRVYLRTSDWLMCLGTADEK